MDYDSSFKYKLTQEDPSGGQKRSWLISEQSNTDRPFGLPVVDGTTLKISFDLEDTVAIAYGGEDC